MVTSHMHYYVITDVETADKAAEIAMGRAREAYQNDHLQLIAVKRNEKRIKPPVAPGQSFLLRSES